jgi:condensin complex subunit 1
VLSQENFDALYCLVRDFTALTAVSRKVLLKLFQTSLNALAALMSSTLRDSAHAVAPSGEDNGDGASDAHVLLGNCKSATKAYAFLTQWALSSAVEQSSKAAEAAKLKKGAKGATTKKSNNDDDGGDDLGGGGGGALDEPSGGAGAASDAEQAKLFGNEADGERLLSAVINVLDVELTRVWKATLEEEFLNLFAKIAYSLIENSALLRSKPIKRCLFQILCMLVKKYNHGLGVTQAVVHMLRSNEALAAPVAELMAMLADEYGQQKAVGDVIREIGAQANSAQDATAFRAFAAFLPELAARVPRVVLHNISLLMQHLGNDNYVLRNGVVQVLGHLARDAFDQSEATQDESLANTRDSLLSILEERFHDVHAFTRSKVLQTWQTLVEAKAVPLAFLPSVTRLTCSRLRDKSANVRKNALALLRTLLQYNPYSGDLSESAFKRSLAAVEQQLGYELRPADRALLGDADDDDNDAAAAAEQDAAAAAAAPLEMHVNDADDELRSAVGDDDDDGGGVAIAVDASSDAAALAEAERLERGPVPAATLSAAEVAKLKVQRKYLRHSLRFIYQMEDAVVAVGKELLGSSVTTDALEAIQFMVIALEFKLEPAKTAVRAMLALVWSKEASVQKAALEAFRTLWLTPASDVARDEQKAALTIVASLIGLMRGMTAADLVSLEECIVTAHRQKLISAAVIEVLWCTFARTLRDATDEDARHALMIIAMLAGADAQIVASRINLLAGAGLGSRWTKDPVLAQYTALALQRMRTTDSQDRAVQLAVSKANPRIAPDHQVLKRLEHVVLEPKVSAAAWTPAATEAINAIFVLSERPADTARHLLTSLAERALDATSKAVAAAAAADKENSGSQDAPAPTPANAFGSRSDRLGKLIFTVGHVALKQLAFIEEVHAELSRRALASTGTSSGAAKDGKDGKKKVEAIEAELGEAAAKATEEADSQREVAERELCGLVDTYGALVVRACANVKGEFGSSETFRSAAVLTLCKLMLVSEQFCEQQLSLLFTVLEREPTVAVRNNVIVCMGDLIARWPNTIDPWIERIFACLDDKVADVRKHALMVLTHLILNDQIKAKTHISKMAFCLEDTDERVQALARLFFHQLAARGQNDVYNLIPDAISRLSRDEHNRLPRDGFRSVMAFLLAFVTKERSSETLLQKIAARFAKTPVAQQWRDLSFCMAQLPVNERGVKKLLEPQTWRSIQASLADEVVVGHLATLAAKARKSVKVEHRPLVDEFEQRLVGDHERLTGKKLAVTQLAVVAGAAKRNANKAGARAKSGGGSKRGGKRTRDSDDDDEEEALSDDDDDDDESKSVPVLDEDSEDEKPKKKRAPAAKKAAPAKKAPRSRKDDSDDEDEPELFDEPEEVEPEPVKVAAAAPASDDDDDAAAAEEDEEDDVPKKKKPAAKAKAKAPAKRAPPRRR